LEYIPHVTPHTCAVAGGIADSGMPEASFEHLLAINHFFDGAARNEAIHHHVAALTDAVTHPRTASKKRVGI
jgi:hypothetical protein